MLFFHMCFDSVKGGIAYIMLDAAGIFGSCFFVNSYAYQQPGQDGMTLVDALCKYFSGLGKLYVAVGVLFDKAFIF